MKDYVDVLNLLPEGYEPSLVNGLQFFIDQVEKMKDDTQFIMSMYPCCVIGTVFDGTNWMHFEESIVQDFFGIDSKKLSRSYGLFSSDSYNMYSDVEWEVICLFTAGIPLFIDDDSIISKYEWLVIAKEHLENVKMGIV